jgi:hypothetical protein
MAPRRLRIAPFTRSVRRRAVDSVTEPMAQIFLSFDSYENQGMDKVSLD